MIMKNCNLGDCPKDDYEPPMKKHYYARITGRDDKGVNVETGWDDTLTGEEFMALFISIMDDIADEKLIRSLWLEAGKRWAIKREVEKWEKQRQS